MIRFVVFSSLFFVFFLDLSAQKPVKEFKSLVRNNEFEKALFIYDRHAEQFGIHEELERIVCLSKTGKLQQAEELLSVYQAKVTDEDDFIFYCKGLLDHLSGRFQQARQHFKDYLGRTATQLSGFTKQLRKEAILRTEQCDKAFKMAFVRSEGFIYMMDPPFSSTSNEYGLHLSILEKGQYYFSSDRHGNPQTDYQGNQVFSYNEFTDDTARMYTKPSGVSSRLLSFFDGGYRAIVELTNQIQCISVEQVWYEDSSYQVPFVAYPGRHISDVDHQLIDGRYLFFSSKRDRDDDSYDLYCSKRLTNGTWALPIHLGSNVNTSYDERYPFYDHRRKLLYFSSNGSESMGGFDIFSVPFDDLDQIGTRQNVGIGINSTYDEITFTSHPLDNNLSYFSSNRPSQLAGFNLYSIYLERSDSVPPIKGIVDSVPLAINPIDTYYISPFFYENLQHISVNKMKGWASVMEKIVLSDSSVLFNIFYHSHDPAPEVSNYFYGITYMNALVEELEKNPLLKDRFQLIAYANHFPLAKSSEVNEINQMSRQLNNRIDWSANKKIKGSVVLYDNPSINAQMRTNRTGYVAIDSMIHYRIQITNTKYPYALDHHQLTDFHIIKTKQSDVYTYYSGLFTDLSAAKLQLVICSKLGLSGAKIVPFRGGFALDQLQIKSSLRAYPDLKSFLD